ncbi:NHL repeat containing protein [Rubrivivax sp. A210]|uniref:6-bladed beta-propeller n=1 Tax=Rubrivivax sp. A210 TaxID=2772301 RepID=UPI00191A8E23|nr:6-bladed beta-propeller [Rubrivivax sp. A210]CAD5372304.1 NHL repeat containing protein [Rubrivivax sp. A210]
MRALLAIGLVLLLAACASGGPVRGQLHYGMDDAPEGRRLLWPAEPEVPRYAYTGTLTGEPNFRSDNAARGALTRFGRWVAGLDEGGEAPTVLQRPAAVIGDDAGRLYVSDTSRQAVFVFDEKAGELLLWDQADGARRFVSPSGLALAADRVFVADAELGAVFVLDRQGQPLARIGAGLLQRPTGLARDPVLGRLYVADTYAHDIKVFSDAGELLQVIGRRGDGDGEFNYPTYLAWAQGELYVTDTLNNRIQVFAADGQLLQRKLGSRGLFIGNLVRPKGVAVDGEGNVYVIESYYDSLLVYSAQGEFLLPIGGTGTATGRFYLPSGVWVDARNRVHVADMFNGRVVLFQFLGGG